MVSGGTLQRDSLSVSSRDGSLCRSGKFLEKMRLKNEATGTWFQPTDFRTGGTITVNRFVFRLLEADKLTRQLLGEGGVFVQTLVSVRDFLQTLQSDRP